MMEHNEQPRKNKSKLGSHASDNNIKHDQFDARLSIPSNSDHVCTNTKKTRKNELTKITHEKQRIQDPKV